MDVHAHEERDTSEPDAQSKQPPWLERFMAEPCYDQRGEEWHHSEQQSRGRTIQPSLCVPEQEPGYVDLKQGVCEQPLPLAKPGEQDLAMPRDRQPPQRTEKGGGSWHHQEL